MPASKDLTGLVFGRWTVKEKFCEFKLDGHIMWVCEYACGNVSRVTTNALNSGHSKSCGCLQKDDIRQRKALPSGEAMFNTLYDQCKRGAAKTGRTFTLSKSDYRTLIVLDCHYCGAKPRLYNRKRANGGFTANGLDRIDNNQGYSVDNCFPCCTDCNFRKGKMDYDAFIKWIYQVKHHWTFPGEK